MRLASTSSTMDALHASQAGASRHRGRRGGPGRRAGSRGRSWSSPRGGLWLSVIARPRGGGARGAEPPRRPRRGGALETLGAEGRIALKWPNDLMLDDRKVRRHPVRGPLARRPLRPGSRSGSGSTSPTRCRRRSRRRPPAWRRCCRSSPPRRWSTRWWKRFAGWMRRPAPLGAASAHDLPRRDWLRGRALAAPVAGTADGLAADGALLVRAADGTTTAVRSGTVALAGTSATADLRHAPDARHRQHRDHRRALPGDELEAHWRMTTNPDRTPDEWAARSAASSSARAIRPTRCAPCVSLRSRPR